MVLLLMVAGSASAAIHQVTQNGDAGIGSLRWAVEHANAGAPGELQEIRFDLAPPFRQINLTSALRITHPTVSISGVQTPSLDSEGRIAIGNTVPGAKNGVFELSATVTRFTLSDLDLGPSSRVQARGGCLDAQAVSPTFSLITLERLRFEGCSVRQFDRVEGGAVYANGSVLIRDSLFFGNRAESLGTDDINLGTLAFGGALAMERGMLTVIGSTFELNVAEGKFGMGRTRLGAGGAVAYRGFNSFGLSFQESLFADNRAGGFDCSPSLAAECSVLGIGGALYSGAASTVLKRSVFARNAAMDGSAIWQGGSSALGNMGRLDLESTVFNAGTSYRGTVHLTGDTARLRQRNVSYHDITVADRIDVAFLYFDTGAQAEVSHSVLFGRANVLATTSGTQRLCFTRQPAAMVPIQGNSLVIEPIDPDTGTHSCAFLGATRTGLKAVGIPATGRWDFEPRGLALETGASGAPVFNDWSRCAPTDFFGRTRPIDGDGDGIAACDIGAIEGEAFTVELFADGFE